ncbi:50S ribosomal protein L33 [Candidatus Hydrogenosomobacter endosymbioticus]|uniref:Large ribosomal subunit protein bL33 n=1 Tax=Candidatus Hydrogenosomobacter endosymbioticus TaxID=2558174 RepID=A0ABN6L7N9_9PROT|nr:50S ribosomal protein L33 [Candidatus Hydrogenosomobacter endosymbioticus]BDB96511.1 50S ribosomal protein L33 [Candidatus Hydrogenosomobacter endosymbioticus]
MAKKKAGAWVRLISSAGTGYFYVAKSSPKPRTEKWTLMKYDPRCRKHVLFTEAKMK